MGTSETHPIGLTVEKTKTTTTKRGDHRDETRERETSFVSARLPETTTSFCRERERERRAKAQGTSSWPLISSREERDNKRIRFLSWVLRERKREESDPNGDGKKTMNLIQQLQKKPKPTLSHVESFEDFTAIMDGEGQDYSNLRLEYDRTKVPSGGAEVCG